MTTYEYLLKQATYALKSQSRDLVYEAYGAAKMARNLGAITSDQMKTLNDMLVRHGLADKMTEQEREKLTRQIESETREDKQAICNALCAALQLTREGADIERLEYLRRPGEEYVIIYRAGNYRHNINVAWDSGAAMIRDIMRYLM